MNWEFVGGKKRITRQEVLTGGFSRPGPHNEICIAQQHWVIIRLIPDQGSAVEYIAGKGDQERIRNIHVEVNSSAYLMAEEEGA